MSEDKTDKQGEVKPQAIGIDIDEILTADQAEKTLDELMGRLPQMTLDLAKPLLPLFKAMSRREIEHWLANWNGSNPQAVQGLEKAVLDRLTLEEHNAYDNSLKLRWRTIRQEAEMQRKSTQETTASVVAVLETMAMLALKAAL